MSSIHGVPSGAPLEFTPTGPSAAEGTDGPAAPAIDKRQVEADTDTLHRAMKGLGTDEDAIYSVLEGRSPEAREAIETRFGEKYARLWPSLSAALHSELSGKELGRAQQALLAGRDVGQRGEIMRDQGAGGSAIGRGARHLITWYEFGIGGKDDAEDGLPRVTGQEIREKMLPNLRPGDTILCGNNGGVSHAMLYLGDGKMIHSMATEKTMRGHSGRIMDVLTAPVDIALEGMGLKERKQGVFVENVADFFDRFERDSYVVMRNPDITPEQTTKGLDHVRDLIGKDYDWDFAPGNDSYYCTEVLGEFYRNAMGDDAPRVGGTQQHYPLLHREAIVDPVDVLRSPDLQPVVANANVMTKHKADLEGRL
ncbi:MAG: YiiX/YebB-like N1pC/P60 family cysteine hydrolase [Planctomycetota bacterium]|jgi:cell wall-associated NlpC family hydrolase